MGKKLIFLASLKTLKRKVRSGVAEPDPGSLVREAVPDAHQKVTDPQH